MGLGQRSSAYRRIASRQQASFGKAGEKFDSLEAENLYSETADDEVSDQATGGSWFGLYRNDAGGGIILEEDQQGFVDIIFRSDSADETAAQWEEIEQSINGEGF